MDKNIELHNQDEMDHDMLYFVREMQRRAPVQSMSIHSFLQVQRHRQVSLKDVQDRVDYLVSAKFLEPITEWQGGEFRHYRITADGMDLLDGAIPPRNWKP
jgi:hypothetical protein